MASRRAAVGPRLVALPVLASLASDGGDAGALYFPGLADALLAAANRPNHALDRAASALACDALLALDSALPGAATWP
ncbi:hypothetical protein ACP4OV_030839 [Aristida adscensionis]